jgi:membrane-bound lytic murein transglycosylase D
MLENEPLVGDDVGVLDPVDLLQGRELTRRREHRDDDSLLSLLPRARRHSFRVPIDDDGADEPSAGSDDGPSSPLVDNDADGPHRFLTHLTRHARRRRETVMYRVGPGDTLVGVAHQFGIDADDVAHQNKLDGGEKLKVGTLIKLKVRKDLVDDLSAGDAKTKSGSDADEKHGKRHRKASHDAG